jgi:tetraacyldisaccharide-1-P 4'-kinase
VSHAYRASPRAARVVSPDEDGACAVRDAGDEALLAARALRDLGARAVVVVAPSRAEGIAFACACADAVVVDGALQFAPRRASLSLLAVDGEAPWGAGHAPPRGDLRASPASLLAACDHVVRVVDSSAHADAHAHAHAHADAHGDLFATVASRGALVADELVPWAHLASLRVHLFAGVARPDRVVRFLARRGVHPVRVTRAADHVRLSARAAARLALGAHDVLLATPKCSVALRAAGVPHAIADYALTLSPSLAARVLDPPGASPVL